MHACAHAAAPPLAAAPYRSHSVASLPSPPPCLPAVAAVHDGYVLQKSVVSTPLAGRLLAQCMAGAVEGRGTTIRPRYEFTRREGHGGKLEARCMLALPPLPLF